jgi:hypothetical protein
VEQLCDLERVEPQPPPSLLLGLEPVQSCFGVARVMSEQKVPWSVEQHTVIKFLVGENIPPTEIHQADCCITAALRENGMHFGTPHLTENDT